jgi:non-ribosomal peptide synthetase component E (peptide arylation enzyme)
MTAPHLVGPDVMHQVTLADVLRDHTRNRPTSLAAVCGEYRLDFPAFDARVNQLAHALTGAGVGEGDRLL